LKRAPQRRALSPPRGLWLRRGLWLLAIWALSVAALGIVAAVLHLLLAPAR
jgi:hypothetical protein